MQKCSKRFPSNFRGEGNKVFSVFWERFTSKLARKSSAHDTNSCFNGHGISVVCCSEAQNVGTDGNSVMGSH